ncbi:MAG: hypothetical protein O3C57_04735 [Verrucomicrobia bacterium]|nr:hypothetical protein [Verrucomicrobiota bacterium]
MTEETFSFSQMCRALGKSTRYIRSLQTAIGLYIAPRGEPYTQSYLVFMRKVVSLRAFSVPIADINELLIKERKILEMLNVDSMSNSPIWFMAQKHSRVQSKTHLLLTGQNLGFDIAGGDVQCNLDYRTHNAELFDRKEMGENIHRAIDLYLDILNTVNKRVRSERAVLKSALTWAGNGFLPLARSVRAENAAIKQEPGAH